MKVSIYTKDLESSFPTMSDAFTFITRHNLESWLMLTEEGSEFGLFQPKTGWMFPKTLEQAQFYINLLLNR